MYDESAILAVCDGVVLLAIRYRGGMLIFHLGQLLLSKLEPHLGATVCKAIDSGLVADTYCLCALFLLVLLPYDGEILGVQLWRCWIL